jgi:hypothetical protein
MQHETLSSIPQYYRSKNKNKQTKKITFVSTVSNLKKKKDIKETEGMVHSKKQNTQQKPSQTKTRRQT